MNPLTQSKKITILPLLITLTLVCFGLSPATRAVLPPPDGGYPGGNTAEGEDALFSLTTGIVNTAIGFNALFSNANAAVILRLVLTRSFPTQAAAIMLPSVLTRS
jgi:hypothetical protein